jgi:hypothetical protein
MNRLLTSIVQIAIAIPALYLGRMAWHMFREDMRELTKDFRK